MSTVATGTGLIMFVVYREPRDQPGIPVVVRKWETGTTPDGIPLEAMGFKSLFHARSHLRGMGLTCLPREANDDPIIVEVWL